MGYITMVVTISVTQEDIADGIKGNSEKCPIGLAMMRQGVATGTGGKSLTIGAGVSIDRENKAKVFEFMEKFDKGKVVTPFEFTMRTETKPTLKY
jgi:hypothetical protein